MLVGGRKGFGGSHDGKRRPVSAAERSRLCDEHHGRADEHERCNGGETTTPIECHDNSCFQRRQLAHGADHRVTDGTCQTAARALC